VPQLLELFASAWWAAGRTEAETRGLLAGSDVVVAGTDRLSGRLVGFARVLTDRTQLALILDVVAAPMFAASAHVRSVELVCQPVRSGSPGSCAGLSDLDRSPGPALGQLAT
jgi:hypothetical protein